MSDPERLEWRRDTMTSPHVRILWSLGVGTFLSMLAIIVFWRLFDLTGQVGGQNVVVAAVAALVVTALVLIVADRTGHHLDGLFALVPGEPPSEEGRRKLFDAIIGTLVMSALIVGLMAGGRYASQTNLFGIGAGPFTGLAALFLPLSLLALLLSSFLRSVGALDSDEQVLYLYDPDTVVDLDTISHVSVRQFGNVAVVSFTYEQPDGQYVPGPRRLAVPPAVASQLETLLS